MVPLEDAAIRDILDRERSFGALFAASKSASSFSSRVRVSPSMLRGTSSPPSFSSAEDASSSLDASGSSDVLDCSGGSIDRPESAVSSAASFGSVADAVSSIAELDASASGSATELPVSTAPTAEVTSVTNITVSNRSATALFRL